MASLPQIQNSNAPATALWPAVLRRWLLTPTPDLKHEETNMTSSLKPLYDGTQDAFKLSPETALASFQATSRQAEGLRSEIKIRQFNLTVDEPEALGGQDAGPNPVELILASLATCQEITYRLYADALGIPLDSVSVTVTGALDLRGFFAVDDTVRPGFTEIKTEVTLDSPAPEAEVARLKATVDRHCPVLDILRNATPVSLDVVSQAPAVAAE